MVPSNHIKESSADVWWSFTLTLSAFHIVLSVTVILLQPMLKNYFSCFKYVCGSVQVPLDARGVRSPGAEVIGSCEPPGMAAGDTTQVLCSRPPSCLSTTELSLQPCRLHVHEENLAYKLPTKTKNLFGLGWLSVTVLV